MQFLYAFFIFFVCCVNKVFLHGLGTGSNGNLRVCVVEGQGSYKRAGKFCPTLDAENSNVECVLGTDRLDCLRRISKGRADFGVFTAEELVAAQWAAADILAVAQVRDKASKPHARNVVALINKRIWSQKEEALYSVEAVLRNLTLCAPIIDPDDIHPLSDTIESYLELLLTRRSCDPNLTMNENKIRAIAEFFGAACRAGAWVTDKDRDRELKKKYPSLCSACATKTCSRLDKYWGEAGALNCVLEGAGDVAFLERDDVIQYFQNKSSSDFQYLCRGGHPKDVKGNHFPCTWITKPWPVVIARSKSFEAVRELMESFHEASVIVDQHWKGALAQLLDLRGPVTALEPPPTAQDYLNSASGFQEAYSQHGCVPSRHITICTTSLLENNKCEWFAEAGAVYGVSPPIQCSRRNSTEECFRAISLGQCDVTVATSDWLVPSKRDYNITPILHEATPIIERTHTVFAYVRKDSNITKMSDLRGKRASFPRYDGVAFHSFARYLKRNSQKESCNTLGQYFSEICAPGIENTTASEELKNSFLKNCYFGPDLKVAEVGEIQALRALVQNESDVAFISMNTYKMYRARHILAEWSGVEIDHLCTDENQHYCFLTWSNIGHIYSAKNLTKMRRDEIINTFTKLDKLFGQHKNAHMFSMYGPYNHVLDVLFHNHTKYLDTDEMYLKRPYSEIPFSFERSNFSDICSLEELSNASLKILPLSISVLCLAFSLIIVSN